MMTDKEKKEERERALGIKSEERKRYENSRRSIEGYNQWIETTVDYWQRRVKEFGEPALVDVKIQIRTLKNQIAEAQKELNRAICDKNENNTYKIEFQKHIDAKERLLERLHALCERYTNKTVQVRPSDKRDWIKEEYSINRANFDTDDDWAVATAKKFKEKFKTDVGDAGSMKRYGKYNGLN